MKSLRPFVFLTVLIGSIAPLTAHDLRGLGDKSIALSNELNVSALTKLGNQQPDPGAKYVFSRLLLWAPGQTLKACFYDGTSNEKEFVRTSIEKLLDGKDINIKIDLGSAPSYRSCTGAGATGGDLRISFSAGCCAAYIGRTALQPDIKNSPSILLQGIIADYEPEIGQQTVMHEVMHALGFNHEHQSPVSQCAFKKQELLTAFGWDEQKFQVNLKQLEQSSRSYVWSSYDPTSIMKYYFDPKYLVEGEQSKCYSKNNLLPSSRDYDGLKLAYPTGAATVSRQQTRDALDVIAASSAPTEVKALARELRRLER